MSVNMSSLNFSQDTTTKELLEEEDDDISSELPSFILEGVLLATAGIFGIIGNIAAILVFGRQRVQRNFHALMVALATFDLTYILVSCFVFALPQFIPDFNQTFLYCHALPFVLPFAQIGLTGSIFLTVAVTVERYFTVCHPFYRVSHSWPAKAYLIPIVCFAFIYNVPKFFELEAAVFRVESLRRAFLYYHNNNNNNNSDNNYNIDVADEWSNEDSYTEALSYSMPSEANKSGFNPVEAAYFAACQNLSQTPCDLESIPAHLLRFTNTPTSLRLNQLYVEVFCGWINFFVHNLFPYALLLVLNGLILRRMKVITAESSGVSKGGGGGVGNAKRKEVALAKISFVIVLVFMVCHSFRWVPNIYELYLFHLKKQDKERILKWPEWVEITSNISHFLSVVNSSVNFYIYLFKHPSIVNNCCGKGKGDTADTMATGLGVYQEEMVPLKDKGVAVAASASAEAMLPDVIMNASEFQQNGGRQQQH